MDIDTKKKIIEDNTKILQQGLTDLETLKIRL